MLAAPVLEQRDGLAASRILQTIASLDHGAESLRFRRALLDGYQTLHHFTRCFIVHDAKAIDQIRPVLTIRLLSQANGNRTATRFVSIPDSPQVGHRSLVTTTSEYGDDADLELSE